MLPRESILIFFFLALYYDSFLGSIKLRAKFLTLLRYLREKRSWQDTCKYDGGPRWFFFFFLFQSFPQLLPTQAEPVESVLQPPRAPPSHCQEPGHPVRAAQAPTGRVWGACTAEAARCVQRWQRTSRAERRPSCHKPTSGPHTSLAFRLVILCFPSTVNMYFSCMKIQARVRVGLDTILMF